VLTRSKPGKDKQGNPIINSINTYHSTPEQCLLAILDREQGNVSYDTGSVELVLDELQDIKQEIIDYANSGELVLK